MGKQRNNYFISGFIVLGISICLFSVAIYYAVDAEKFMAGSVETLGVIEDYVENDSTDSRGRAQTDYYPLIKYCDSSGASHLFRCDTAMNYEVSIFKEAKDSGFKSTLFKAPKVKVRYLADNPGVARSARTFFDIWGHVVVITIISIAVCFVGCALLWFDYERKAEESKQSRHD